MKTILAPRFGAGVILALTTLAACGQDKATSTKDFQPHSPWNVQFTLRQDWTDVYDNNYDQQNAGKSQDSSADKSSPQHGDNADGATFSFSRNGVANNDSWSAEGAAMIDISYLPDLPSDYGFHLTSFDLGPSIAINKVSNSSVTNNNVDHVYAVLGQSATFIYYPTSGNGSLPFPFSSFVILGLQERAGFVYDTDTSFKARLPGYVFELEPQVLHNFDDTHKQVPWMTLGWQNRFGLAADGKTALVLFQCRAWFHLEGGDIQQSASDWNVVTGSFLRMGPEVRGQMTFPQMKGVSVTGEYDYVPTVSGQSGLNSLYKLGLSLPIYQGKAAFKEGNQKIALAANYTKGGLVLSKQSVDLFTVGISFSY